MDKNSNLVLRNESGAALVVALLMIVVLSLIGLASSSTSTFEIRLSGNKRGATDAFYSSDAGVQAVMAGITNFNTSSGYQIVTDPILPVDLRSTTTGETIDQRNISPTPVLPTGMSFTAAPNVTIYHMTTTKVPRGLGMSAIAFQYNYYIIDAIGRDQMDLGTVRSNCEIREKIVRLIPTGN